MVPGCNKFSSASLDANNSTDFFKRFSSLWGYRKSHKTAVGNQPNSIDHRTPAKFFCNWWVFFRITVTSLINTVYCPTKIQTFCILLSFVETYSWNHAVYLQQWVCFSFENWRLDICNFCSILRHEIKLIISFIWSFF